MKAEGLLEQNLVLHGPLVWKRREVWQVGQRLVDIVFVPEEHPQSLKTKTGKFRRSYTSNTIA